MILRKRKQEWSTRVSHDFSDDGRCTIRKLLASLGIRESITARLHLLRIGFERLLDVDAQVHGRDDELRKRAKEVEGDFVSARDGRRGGACVKDGFVDADRRLKQRVISKIEYKDAR